MSAIAKTRWLSAGMKRKKMRNKARFAALARCRKAVRARLSCALIVIDSLVYQGYYDCRKCGGLKTELRAEFAGYRRGFCSYCAALRIRPLKTMSKSLSAAVSCLILR